MQQNLDGSGFFKRTWAEYKAGFGAESGNYWIGNERLHQLTSGGDYKLKVYVQSLSTSMWYSEEFSTFIVGDEASNYVLTSVGSFSGTAGPGDLEDLGGMGNVPFSTWDQDAYGCVNNVQRSNGGGGWFDGNCDYGMYQNVVNAQQTTAYYRFSWFGLPGGPTLKTSRLVLIKK